MRSLLTLVTFFASAMLSADEPRSLFDGTTLAGWEALGSEHKWWTVADGAIVGGSLTEKVPHNTFLATRDSFGDFELTLKIRIRGAGGFVNSGIQIRSTRVDGSNEMKGYQVDAGPDWWGKLYDESRRNKVLAGPQDPQSLAAAVKPDDWNEYRIEAIGPRIRSWINGAAALDYVEPDAAIPLQGRIGIQVHGGGKALVEVKDVAIRALPLAEAVKPPPKKLPPPAEPLSAADEARHFSLADGFTAELVLDESTDPANPYGKFVALAFDSHGRLWTTTALEYPLDANENAEASQRLFATGGRDKVLVVDNPWAKEPSPPRVFADGLALPLGVLPLRDGALVQYGTEIRFYRDTDGDGRADGFDVVLQGFGVQDSHLFPHQFTRVPGDWILLAQGLFNTSTVRRPGSVPFADGASEVRFDACKLARFRPDGSLFEPVTAGPNNIWGLTISREGETWLQEANDLGYPIFPYEPGVLAPTGSRDRLRPYQPMMPAPLGPPQMGGTGLSGLAIADDLDGWPGTWGAGAGATPDERVFYVANPITSCIQSIIATRTGDRYDYRKGPDLLTSTDKAFRPVAVQFGPDGCLYVVDWYNKIISHNEVPRAHPERDRVRGRIWRIRHAAQPVQEPIAVARVPTEDLPKHLGAKNARIADVAWQEIIDRDAKSLVPSLTAIALDPSASVSARAGSLWALEGLGAASPAILEKLVADPSADLRHEAIRVAGTNCSESEFRKLARPLLDDRSARVRAALGDAFRRIPVTEPETITLMIALGREPLPGDSWTAYDRLFERFLVRWALEKHAPAVAAFLESPRGQALPVENRLLATLALEPRTAAMVLAGLLPEITRPLDAQEVHVLADHVDVAEVASALERIARDPVSRVAVLRSLLEFRTSIPQAAIKPIMARAADDLLGESARDAERILGLELTGAFRIQNLEGRITALLASADTSPAVQRAALRALRELGGASAATVKRLLELSEKNPRLRAEAIAACAESRDADGCTAVVESWDAFSFTERPAVATLLARHRQGAIALVKAFEADEIDPSTLPIAVLTDMRATLKNNPVLEAVWHEITSRAPSVLRLAGDAAGGAARVSLDGPFTVEAWVNLEPPITNDDSILAAAGVLDMNFAEGQFRVWTKARGDIVVARAPTMPDAWTHYAVTRDAEGTFRIFANGELDAESTSRDTSAYNGLRIGASSPPRAGTTGRIAEFRVWDSPRTGDEIRADFDRSYAGDDARPKSLVRFHGGDSWGELAGKARIDPAVDLPRLVTAEELNLRAEKFTRFRQLAEAGGDAVKGKAVFTTRCLTCHQQGGQGGKVGPALDGLGLTGTEAILRNVLTPSAAMEGGYRAFRVLTRDGRIVQGLLVSRDAESIVIRQPDTADISIPVRDIDQADFTGISIMPEGLLEAMLPEEASDLFAYLKSLGTPVAPSSP
jgi:putative heme-binding domain-containing protein